MTRVVARTGARLHFGLILGSPANGWEFGGAGLMVAQPGWKIILQVAAEDHIRGGSADAVVRITRLLQRLRSLQPLPPLQITVESEIPPHAGLGSGTQLSLALTAAAGWLVSGLLPPPAEQLAAISARSERSAIGTAGFDHGGFLADQGRSAPYPRVQRLALPDQWRFLVVRPINTQGLSGDAEQQWFEGRREMPPTLTNYLAKLIHHQLLPAVAGADAAAFAEALETYGDAVGGFYAPAQGGTFSHPSISKLVARLRQQGIHGAAQSSWGPGVCIPAASESAAMQILAEIPHEIDGWRLETTVAEPLNTGASISREAPPATQRVFA
jgi:beta-ribofuranosylaminobenzene 5'-phosphate synthase